MSAEAGFAIKEHRPGQSFIGLYAPKDLKFEVMRIAREQKRTVSDVVAGALVQMVTVDQLLQQEQGSGELPKV